MVDLCSRRDLISDGYYALLSVPKRSSASGRDSSTKFLVFKLYDSSLYTSKPPCLIFYEICEHNALRVAIDWVILGTNAFSYQKPWYLLKILHLYQKKDRYGFRVTYSKRHLHPNRFFLAFYDENWYYLNVRTKTSFLRTRK